MVQQGGFDLIVTSVVLALLPLLMIGATSFVKISCVLFIVRNAIGIQQVPPNVVINVLALVLSLLVMFPIAQETALTIQREGIQQPAELLRELPEVSEPLRAFLTANARKENVEFFLAKHQELMARRNADPTLDAESFAVLLPAFLVGEISQALFIGFILYLPLLLVDLVIAIILQTLGMNMVSPTVFSLPVKIVLFISVNGWERVLDLLIMSYR